MTDGVELGAALGARAFVALGSNLGDRLAHLRHAVARLDRQTGVHVSAVSPVYESAAHVLVPNGDAPSYLNAVIEVRSRLSPRDLLSVCLDVERSQGRERSRSKKWASRIIDVDLLVFDEVSLEEPDLTLPHPRMGERRFVLLPLAAIAREFYVPIPFGATVQELLETCPDQGAIRRTSFRLAP